MNAKSLLALCVLLFCGISAAFPAADGETSSWGIHTGVIRQGRVFAFGVSARPHPQVTGGQKTTVPELMSQPLHPSPEKKMTDGDMIFWDLWITGQGMSAFQWRIGGDVLWCFHPKSYAVVGLGRSMYIPFKDMTMWDATNPQGLNLLQKKFGGNVVYCIDYRNWTLDRNFNPEDPPFREDPDDPVKKAEVHWDFLPMNDEMYFAFFIHKQRDKTPLEVWYQKLQRPSDSREVDSMEKAKYKKMETEATFFEPFLSYADKERFYFVTQSGKVFAHARPKDNVALRKTGTDWDNPNCPVTIVLTDEKSGRTFVAGPDNTKKDEPKWFWFELSPYPQKKLYEPGPEPKVKESLRSVLCFARFLDAKGILSNK